MFKGTLEEYNGTKIVGMDTITQVVPQDAGHVVLCASHGGVSSGSYATKYQLMAVFFNDAGVGKDDAGIAALAMLEERGTASGAYSHNTAWIGDALDAWENGVISFINDTARKKGFREGEGVKEALRRCVRENGGISGAQ